MQPEQQTVSIPRAIQIGMEHHQAGRLAEAERAYQQYLLVDPDNPDVLHLLAAPWGLSVHMLAALPKEHRAAWRSCWATSMYSRWRHRPKSRDHCTTRQSVASLPWTEHEPPPPRRSISHGSASKSMDEGRFRPGTLMANANVQ